MRMTQYTYDCLTKKYTSVTLGTAAPTLEGTMVSAHQLAAGSITGMKLALNSIGNTVPDFNGISYAKQNQKYCSHACYIMNRFGKERESVV